MDANEIKINRKRRLGNTSISDFFQAKVCITQMEAIMLAVK